MAVSESLTRTAHCMISIYPTTTLIPAGYDWAYGPWAWDMSHGSFSSGCSSHRHRHHRRGTFLAGHSALEARFAAHRLWSCRVWIANTRSELGGSLMPRQSTHLLQPSAGLGCSSSHWERRERWLPPSSTPDFRRSSIHGCATRWVPQMARKYRCCGRSRRLWLRCGPSALRTSQWSPCSMAH